MMNYEEFNALTNYNLDHAFKSIQKSEILRQRICNVIDYLRETRKDEFVSVNEICALFSEPGCKYRYKYVIDHLTSAHILAWEVRKEEFITIETDEWNYAERKWQTVKKQVQVKRKYVKYVGC